jgi:prepilin-type N-terminal cleavage/methylation domain-containing protein
VKKSKAKGFTMLEIIVAVVIITSVAIGVMGAILHTRRSSNMMQQRMMAVQLINQKLTDLKSQSGKLVSQDNVLITDSDAIRFLKNSRMSIVITQLDPVDSMLKKAVVTIGWDYPWTQKTQTCELESVGETRCDRQESVATALYKE